MYEVERIETGHLPDSRQEDFLEDLQVGVTVESSVDTVELTYASRVHLIITSNLYSLAFNPILNLIYLFL